MKETILHKALSASCRNFLAQAGMQAYQYSHELLDSTPLILTKRGGSLFPHLVNVVYDLFVKNLCDKGEIPFVAKEEANVQNNSYFMVFCSDILEFTVSRLSSKNSFPRYANFRHNYALNNDLLSLFPEYEQERPINMAYAILTHGGSSNGMYFSQIGVPRTGTQSWIGKPMVLFDRQRITEVKYASGEDIIIEKPKLKIIKDMLGEKIE